ncbi:MAG TPA: hypothetical protein VFY17_11755, partial [Pilimelia sp.]|nr:hypothetical protein [Pilimelia sp.]
ALDRVGLVRAEQLQALQERVDALAAQVAGATGGAASRGRGRAAGDGAPAKKSTGGPSAGADAAPKKVARKSVKKAASPDGHRDAADPDGPAR